ncbi:MAG: RDD family protein [Sulfurospirillaceae bacterium]|nr:RDD family protein [Sulfurospirillaceae bacterium]
MRQKIDNTPQIAPIVNRAKAFVTDSFMIFMPLCYIVIYVVLGSREEFRAHMLYGWIAVLIPHFIIITLFLHYKGQTPGYKAYDIKLLNKKAEKATLSQIVARYFLFTFALFVFPLLITPFFRKDKKSLHDVLTQTYPAQITQ